VNVSITDINETRKDVVVTFDGSEIAEEETRILKSFKKQAKIPGFRPGKAPEARIRQVHGKALREELKTAVMRSAYDAVFKHEDLDVYTLVEFPEPGDVVPGEEMSIDLTVDVRPSFEVPEYVGLKTQVPPSEVTDEEIEQTIDRIRRQRADFAVVERAAQASDYVKVSYAGKLGDEDLSEKLKDQPRLQAWGVVTEGWEEAGTDEAKQYGVPAVIDALVGMSAGDRKTVTQVIPDEFLIEDLQGKEVTYEIEAHEVRERKLPEVDEAFLKSVNAETLEDFKAQIMDQLEGQKKREGEDRQRTQILDQLASAVDFPLPQTALEAETQNAMARLISQNMQQGVPEEEFEKHKEQIHAGASQAAARDVKLQLILAKIAEKESITVETEDLSRAVYSLAMQQQQKPEDLAKELRKDRQRLSELQRQILFSKTVDFLVSKAETEEVAEAPEQKSES
jgi:trigger factor